LYTLVNLIQENINTYHYIQQIKEWQIKVLSREVLQLQLTGAFELESHSEVTEVVAQISNSHSWLMLYAPKLIGWKAQHYLTAKINHPWQLCLLGQDTRD